MGSTGGLHVLQFERCKLQLRRSDFVRRQEQQHSYLRIGHLGGDEDPRIPRYPPEFLPDVAGIARVSLSSSSSSSKQNAAEQNPPGDVHIEQLSLPIEKNARISHQQNTHTHTELHSLVEIVSITYNKPVQEGRIRTRIARKLHKWCRQLRSYHNSKPLFRRTSSRRKG